MLHWGCVWLGNPDLDFENVNPDFPIERTLRSFGSCRIKGIDESTLDKDSSVPLTHHDPNDLRVRSIGKSGFRHNHWYKPSDRDESRIMRGPRHCVKKRLCTTSNVWSKNVKGHLDSNQRPHLIHARQRWSQIWFESKIFVNISYIWSTSDARHRQSQSYTIFDITYLISIWRASKVGSKLLIHLNSLLIRVKGICKGVTYLTYFWWHQMCCHIVYIWPHLWYESKKEQIQFFVLCEIHKCIVCCIS